MSAAQRLAGWGAASGSAGIPAGSGKPVFRDRAGLWWVMTHIESPRVPQRKLSLHIYDPMEKAWLPRPLLMGEGRLGVRGAPTVAEPGPQPGFKCRSPSQAFDSARRAGTWRQPASPRAGLAPNIGRQGHRGLDLKGEECVKGHRTGVPARRGGEAFLGDREAAPAPGHPHPPPGRPEASQPGPQLLSGP